MRFRAGGEEGKERRGIGRGRESGAGWKVSDDRMNGERREGEREERERERGETE